MMKFGVRLKNVVLYIFSEDFFARVGSFLLGLLLILAADFLLFMFSMAVEDTPVGPSFEWTRSWATVIRYYTQAVLEKTLRVTAVLLIGCIYTMTILGALALLGLGLYAIVDAIFGKEKVRDEVKKPDNATA